MSSPRWGGQGKIPYPQRGLRGGGCGLRGCGVACCVPRGWEMKIPQHAACLLRNRRDIRENGEVGGQENKLNWIIII